MKYNLELIKWDDCCSHDGTEWRNIEDEIKFNPTINISVGYVTRENDYELVITPHIYESGAAAFGSLRVLKSMIKKRKIIRRATITV